MALDRQNPGEVLSYGSSLIKSSMTQLRSLSREGSRIGPGTAALATVVAGLAARYIFKNHVYPAYTGIKGFFLDPLHYVYDWEDQNQGGRTTRLQKRLGEYPPVYPNGWFKLCDSRELKPGEAIQRKVCGLDLAVFRSTTAPYKVSAIDLYCTHLGANLTVGGVVRGSSLVCPFHHWAFDGSGKCVDIGEPGLTMPILGEDGEITQQAVGEYEVHKAHVQLDPAATEATVDAALLTSQDACGTTCTGPKMGVRIPSQAHSKGYTVIEKNEMVWLWFNAEGEEPYWEIPDTTPGLRTHGKCVHHVYCHIQDIPENGPDAAHLNIVHQETASTGGLIMNIWGARWRAGDPRAGEEVHSSYFQVQHVSTWKNKFNIPFTSVDVQGRQIGPGLVMFRFETVLGMFEMVQTVVPVGPLHQVVEHVIFAPARMPRFLGKFFMKTMTSYLEQDIPIWNCKTFHRRPVFVKNDGPIPAFRKWYAQFYSENSPTLEKLRESSTEW